jgi:hypothetical protein
MIAARMDVDKIAASFREIARARGRPLAGVMRASGRRIAVRLTRITQPFGFDEGAKDNLKSMIQADVRGLFNSPSRLYILVKEKQTKLARAFYSAVKNGDSEAALQILESVGLPRTLLSVPDRSTHRASRDEKGRVSASQKDRLAVFDADKISSYAQEVEKRIGITAAGWAECAKQLGGYRGLVSGQSIPRWKRASGRRHGGSAYMTGEGNDPKVFLENNVPWLTNACKASDMQKAVLQETATIERELDRALQHELRRTGLSRF